MGKFSDLFSRVYRDSEVDGVLASGRHEPAKADIRSIGTALDSALSGLASAVVAGGGVAAATAALLAANLVPANGISAIVYADPDATKNGLYIKAGATGTGSWTATALMTDPTVLQTQITALQALVNSLPASAFSLIISGFTATPAVAEAGSTVASVALAWTLNKAVTSQTLDGATIATTARTATKTGGFTTNQNFALAASDGTNIASATASLVYLNKGHAGTINKSDGATLTSADVNGMSQAWFADAVTRVISFTTTADGFIWYSQPASQADPSGFTLSGRQVVPVKTMRSHVRASDGQAISYKDFLLSDLVSAGTAVIIGVTA